jgi:hypothetical protein
MEQQKNPGQTGTGQKGSGKDQHSTQHDKGQGQAGSKKSPSQHPSEKR